MSGTCLRSIVQMLSAISNDRVQTDMRIFYIETTNVIMKDEVLLSKSDSLILERVFYERNTFTVARELLGKILVRETENGGTSGRIVETEASIDRSIYYLKIQSFQFEYLPILLITASILLPLIVIYKKYRKKVIHKIMQRINPADEVNQQYQQF